jgi:hypothetical protein
MVKARDSIQKGNNTTPKEIWCDSSNANFDKVCIVVIGVLWKWITSGQNLKRLQYIL